MKYLVVRFDDGGETLTILDLFDTEGDADNYRDLMASKYPNAWIETITWDDYLATK
jgi:hypothetical protein